MTTGVVKPVSKWVRVKSTVRMVMDLQASGRHSQESNGWRCS
jgi:hypothetical protein